MPAKRIPDLTAISGASTANDDNLVIFDTDADETKRILRSQLAAGLVGDLPLQYYLGILTSAPSTRLDGGVLQIGDYYLDSATKYAVVYNGSGWSSYASVIAAQTAAEAAATSATASASSATASASTATTQASLATTAKVDAEAAEVAAQAAQAAAETARDAAFVNADVYADTAAGLAAVALGEQFQVVSGDEIIRYREDAGPVATEVARYLSSAGAQKVGGRNERSFPRDRAQFGLINHPAPTTMTANSATITEWGRFSIPAGIGEDYRTVASSNFAFSQSGARALFFLIIDAGSGTHSAPNLELNSTTLGVQNLSMVEELPGLWVLEQTIPASGYSSITFTLTSTDAVNSITGSLLHFCVSPVGASGLSMQRDAQSLENWVVDDYREGPGNVWPIEKATLPVTSGDSLEAKRVNGITFTGGEEALVLVYAESASGGPAIVDRLYIRAVSQIPGTTLTENVFIEPVANHPGVYARWVKFTSALGPTSYLELNVDNAQASAFYTQEAVEVKATQIYRRPPASFYSPSLLTFAASDGIIARNFDGLLDVYTPMNTPRGNEYIQWQSRRYDTTGNPAGGGIGSVLEDLFYCRRSGEFDFAPVYRLTDNGLNEFAMKKDDGTNQNVGHNVHGGQARRAAPSFKIDNVIKTATARDDFKCSKVEWIEYTEIYDILDGTTVIANLDTTKTWEGNTFKLKQEITFLANVDLLTLYLFMFSPYASVDNVSALGLVFDEIAMPDQGGALYPPGGGVNATYPSETHFIATGPMNWTFNIEVQGSVLSEFRSWVQSGSSSRKFYMSAIGQRDSFGLIPERIPYPVTTGATFSQETWITATKV